MKKILIILSCIFIISCAAPLDRERYINHVKSSFPDSQVYSFYRAEHQFIVIDSTGVKMVETYGNKTVFTSNVYFLKKQQ